MNITLSFDWLKELVHPNPGRDWLIVLGLGLVTVLAGVGLAVYLFWGIQTGSIIGGTSAQLAPPVPISRATLKKVLDAYQLRAANYTGANFPVFNLTDPHIRTTKK